MGHEIKPQPISSLVLDINKTNSTGKFNSNYKKTEFTVIFVVTIVLMRALAHRIIMISTQHKHRKTRCD